MATPDKALAEQAPAHAAPLRLAPREAQKRPDPSLAMSTPERAIFTAYRVMMAFLVASLSVAFLGAADLRWSLGTFW